MAIWISCIVPNDSDPDSRIAAVGGLCGWTEGEERVIDEIEDGANYCVEVEDERVDVVVVQHGGRKYLTTDPDHTTTNKLTFLYPTAPDSVRESVWPIAIPQTCL